MSAEPPRAPDAEAQEEDDLSDLTPEERDELERVLEAGFDDIAAGRVVDGDEVMRRLLARNRT